MELLKDTLVPQLTSLQTLKVHPKYNCLADNGMRVIEMGLAAAKQPRERLLIQFGCLLDAGSEFYDAEEEEGVAKGYMKSLKQAWKGAVAQVSPVRSTVVFKTEGYTLYRPDALSIRLMS